MSAVQRIVDATLSAERPSELLHTLVTTGLLTSGEHTTEYRAFDVDGALIMGPSLDAERADYWRRKGAQVQARDVPAPGPWEEFRPWSDRDTSDEVERLLPEASLDEAVRE
jgi:hypothetical protein